MNSRLKKRGILALVIYFLMITAVSTPIAFYTGKARGATRIDDSAAGAQGLSQSDTEANKLDPPFAVAMGVGNHDQGAATPHTEAGATPRISVTPRAPSLKPAALRDAVLRALTTSPSLPGGDGADNNPQSPLSLAMAPNAAPGGLTEGGTPNPAAGYPGALIPGFTPATTGTNNSGDGPINAPAGGPEGAVPTIVEPPVIVTPVPAALPLMLTGFASLLAFGKRARR